jgi:cation diffusion facilitator family transporter
MLERAWRPRRVSRAMYATNARDPQARADNRRAMRLSLVVGVFMLVGKVGAYLVTGSAAILSDAAESVIHVVAVAFAAFSLALSFRPADRDFRYGYERIAFFSAGFEGAMIVVAAIAIIVAAVDKWLHGLTLDRLGLGTLVVAAAAALNAGLGLYLVRRGRRTNSLILEANGRHVLTDSWTSVGVVGGLLLVLWTGWKPFDPIIAILVALNILRSGGQLIRRSVAGLMDYSDPAIATVLEPRLQQVARELGVTYHHVRFRHTGHRVIVELHLLFPYETPVGEAHRQATAIEERLPAEMPYDTEVVTHLEAEEDHEEVHRAGAH